MATKIFLKKFFKKVKKGVDNAFTIVYNNARRLRKAQAKNEKLRPHVARLKRWIHRNGSLAQLGEHLPYKQRVTGSIPVTSTKVAR